MNALNSLTCALAKQVSDLSVLINITEQRRVKSAFYQLLLVHVLLMIDQVLSQEETEFLCMQP